MKGKMITRLGDIVIDSEVIAQCAGLEAMTCFGVVGMAAVSMKDGLVRLLKRDSITRGVKVRINENNLTLDFHIIVANNIAIKAVSENVREHVKYKVENFTGLNVEKINIYVEGVRNID